MYTVNSDNENIFETPIDRQGATWHVNSSSESIYKTLGSDYSGGREACAQGKRHHLGDKYISCRIINLAYRQGGLMSG